MAPYTGVRYFCVHLSVIRIYTSALQTCRCPPKIQVGALFAVMCAWRLLSSQQYMNYANAGPNGTLYTDHGLPWMDKPPYLGYILHGVSFIVLPYLFTYSFAYQRSTVAEYFEWSSKHVKL